MKPKHANKRDANHAAIAEYLTAHGVSVTDTSAAGHLPDMLVAYGTKDGRYGFVGWLEVKVETGAKFTWTQLNWIATKSGRYPVRIVTNREDALEFALTNNGAMTQKQKDNLAAFCLRSDKRKLYTPGQVREAMG